MRWHPTMIKWCIYMHHLSSSTYNTLRNSGCLRPPSDRTLRDYTHCISSKAGSQIWLVNSWWEKQKLEVEKWQKHIVLIYDEMHVREKLVYHKATGELVGFVDLGDINNHPAQLERSCQAPAISFSQLEVGTKILCYVVFHGSWSLHAFAVSLCCFPMLCDFWQHTFPSRVGSSQVIGGSWFRSPCSRGWWSISKSKVFQAERWTGERLQHSRVQSAQPLR